MDRKIVSISYTPNWIRSHQAWWLHWNLAKATEIINQIWSIQLFLWICKLFLNVICRTYKIMNEPKNFSTVYGAFIASSSFFHLCILIICCHLATIQVEIILYKSLFHITSIDYLIFFCRETKWYTAYSLQQEYYTIERKLLRRYKY